MPTTACLLLTLLATDVAGSTARALSDELKQDFRETLGHGFQIVGAGPSTAIRADTQGLVIRLGANRQADDGAGVAARFRISGDFEVTVAYEMLSVTKPEAGFGAGIKLWASVGTTPRRAVTFAHLRRVKSDNQFVALVATWHSEDEKSFDQRAFDADVVHGRLRLSRVGSKLRFAVAEADRKTFREVHESDIGTEDVDALRILATSSKARAAVSIRLQQVEIRAARIGIERSSTGRVGASRRWWWATTVLLGSLAGTMLWRAIKNRRDE